jgi:hypothetical protein
MKIDYRTFVLALAPVALSACAAYPRTEADFGNSVREMISAQTANPGPADPAAPEEGDGERLNSVVEAYRSDVSRAGQPAQNVSVSFGEIPQAGQ